MTTVAQISGAVRRLPKRDLAKFRKWFVEYRRCGVGPAVCARCCGRPARQARS